MKKSLIIRALIILEIGIIAFLGFFIYKSRTKIVISPILKKHIQINKTKNYKYFYEPAPESVEIIENDWLPNSAYITINKDSLNERFDYSLKKEKGVYRILTLGDSFTFGDNISTVSNWTELLEDELNNNHLCKEISKYEVINLGMSGYDIEYEVERYRVRGAKYNPDLVIWTFGDLKRFKEDASELSSKLRSIDINTLGTELTSYYGQDAIKLTSKENILLDIAIERIARQMSIKDIIDRQKEAILSFDSLYQNKLLYLEINYADKLLVSGIFNGLVDERKRFDRYENISSPDYRLEDWHFNKPGHILMNQNVISTLEQKNILPCKNIKTQKKTTLK